jgi:hypothetical protein
MKLIKLIRRIFQIGSSCQLYEVKDGSHMHFISMNDWVRSQKEKTLNQFQSGRYGQLNSGLRTHCIKNTKGNKYER